MNELNPKITENINLGIFEYLKETEVDMLMKNAIANSGRRGGNNPNKIWNEGLLNIRHSAILELYCHKGMSQTEVARQISSRWECCLRSAQKYVSEAMSALTKDYDKYQDTARTAHLRRLEAIMQDCLDRGQTEQALKAMDQISKINGYYNETKTLKVEAPIKFEFGE